MKRVRGMYEAVSKYCPSIMSSKEQAKVKILRGNLDDHLDFKEELFQKNAFIRCEDGVYNYEFGYSIPIIDIDRYSYNGKINIVYNQYLERTALRNDTTSIKQGYEVVTRYIDNSITPIILTPDLIKESYKDNNLKIGYKRRGKSFGLIVGLSGDEILFMFGLRAYCNNQFLDFKDIENQISIEFLDDRIQFKFTIEDGVSFDCYLEGERYDLKLGN